MSEHGLAARAIAGARALVPSSRRRAVDPTKQARTVADLVRDRAEEAARAEPTAEPSATLAAQPLRDGLAARAVTIVPAAEPAPPNAATGSAVGPEAERPVREPAMTAVAARQRPGQRSAAEQTPIRRTTPSRPAAAIVASPAWPSTAEPSTTEPSTTEPSTTEPSTTTPSTTEQLTTEPRTTEPDNLPQTIRRPPVTARTQAADAALAPPWVRAALMGVRPLDPEPTVEQAAASLALRRTFGLVGDPGPVTLAGVETQAPTVVPLRLPPGSRPPGTAVEVRFRVVRRDGSTVPGAGVTLLDGRGTTVASAVAASDGRGALAAPHVGAYMLVAASAGDQPAAVALTVGSAAVEVDLLVARWASVSGTVRLDGRAVPTAQITLVQDGEVVDVVATEVSGAYLLADLTGGEYALAVAAPGCAPAVVVIDVPAEGALTHDVELSVTRTPAPAS